MEDHRYISCIKINGIPIIPPVMTEDVRYEMNHYKKLAIALEEKLKSSQAIKNIVDNTNEYIINDRNRYNKKLFRTDSIDSDSVTDNSLNSDIESVNHDTTTTISTTIIPTKISTEEKADTISICDATEDDTTISELTIKQDIPELKTNTNQRPSDSDNSSQNGIHLMDKTMSGSESITTSADLNSYLNDTTLTKSNTAETTPEIRKPQAPKTLDIVPITLDEPTKNENANDVILERNSMDNSPKLIRQGSYILDTPSPMLLAHMQLESTEGNYVPNNDYMPTPTATSIARRKEWNITQAKTDWETQIKNKEYVIAEMPKTSSDMKRRRSSASCSNQKTHKSINQKKTESLPSIHHSTSSADCIQAMLAKEYICKNGNKPVFHNQRYSDVYIEKNNTLQSQKANDNISVLNLANKLSGSLGSLNIGTQYTKQTEREYNDTFLNRSFDEKLLRNNETQHSPSKLISSITSEKLLTILRNIQEMHKKQMLELITRQQKEQTLLQQEFERQQVLLLTHIKKSCPELPGMAFATNTLSYDIDKQTHTCNENFHDPSKAVCPLEHTNCELCVQEEDKIALQNQHIKMLPCSSNHDDGINRMQLRNSMSCLTIHSSGINMSNPTLQDSVRKTECLYVNNDENFRLQGINQYRKQLSVSRQLFPLDGNTTQVPILDRPAYTEKHIQAATVINAYTKGYLVRRLMKTDRVIRLKNTYKEALQCMLRLHVDAPLNLPELNFLHRLQLQCDAASMNIVELFAQPPAQRMPIIAHDREIKRSRTERPSSARSYSFATQRTLARKKLKEMGDCELSGMSRSYTLRTRCQTWASDIREKPTTPHTLYPGIKRSTSAGAVRRPWR